MPRADAAVGAGALLALTGPAARGKIVLAAPGSLLLQLNLMYNDFAMKCNDIGGVRCPA